jgi:gamma-glutamyltranspeptidase/glutathione hydrolase
MSSFPRLAGVPLVALVALVVLPLVSLDPDLASAARGQATRSVVHARHGMVCASQPLAVQAGVEILKAGGSAADAAIATNACLGLMEPTANGLGGDLFAILWDPKAKKVVGLNASGRAPLALTIEKVPPEKDGTIPLYSPYSWTVPGAADGWFELHAKYGKLPMKQILAPAIRYAEEGFPLSPVIADDWARSVSRFQDKPGFREVFMPGGRAPKEGEIFRNPALAKTLRLLAEKGRDAYYKGPIADALVRYSEANGGFFAKEDFARHASTWDAPMATDYRGVRVWELPPNSQGLAALQLLDLIENFDLKSMGRESADFWHVFVEAKKVAFADRARYYADPAFAKIPVEQLLSKDYARQRAALIERKGRLLLVRRAEGALLGRMWEVPQTSLESAGLPDLARELRDRHGLEVTPGALRVRARHAITYRRIRVEGYATILAGRAPADSERFCWVTAEEARSRPVSSMTRKLFDGLATAQLPLAL